MASPGGRKEVRNTGKNLRGAASQPGPARAGMGGEGLVGESVLAMATRILCFFVAIGISPGRKRNLHLTHRGASWASGAAQAAHVVRIPGASILTVAVSAQVW